MKFTPALRATRERISGASYRTKLIAGISIAAIGVLASGSMAYALWNADATVSGGTITAGEFDLVYGSGSWSQVTPGVTNPAGGALADGTDGFHSMPGDVVEIRIPLTTTLRGDNLAAAMNVAMGAGAAQDLEDGVIAATYRVEDVAQDPASEEAELGTPVQVAGLVGSNDGVTSSWTVVVTVSVLGDYRWSDAAPLLNLDDWTVDGISVTLEQVRAGDDFVESGS